MNDFNIFLQNGHSQIVDVLRRFGVDSETAVKEAGIMLDISALILAEKLTGKDTSIAEAALLASRKNLEAVSSLTVANLVRDQTQGFLVLAASTVGQAIFRSAI